MTGVTAKMVAAVEFLARSDRSVAAVPGQWDKDPWLFNTWTGTVELKTGELREHRRLDYITKLSPIGPGGDCPMFHEFMRTIFAEDIELIDYLQKFFGYILTGETREHVMLFFHGTGANGKSVLISTISGILGTYHRVAPIDTFTVGSFSSHPTDMGKRRAARNGNRNGRGAPLGRKQDQRANRRRQDHRALHAPRLLRIYSGLQTHHCREP